MIGVDFGGGVEFGDLDDFVEVLVYCFGILILSVVGCFVEKKVTKGAA